MNIEMQTSAGIERAAELQAVYDYHERTKHRFSGYAKGPGSLDWDAQPDPFRVYAHSESIELPLDELASDVSYAKAVGGAVPARELSLLSIAQLLRLAFGITAWKELPDGTRWALRANPSSGNLHPTEAWLLVCGCADLKNGLYHYDCREHALQLRCEWSNDCEWPSEANDGPQLLVALSTIYWREAWKYGERAFRYCQLDIGHAAAALGFATAALGWRAQQITVSSDDLDMLLGLDREEHATVEQESGACLFQIQVQSARTAKRTIQSLMQQAKAGSWHGQPNRLDAKPMYAWPAIATIAAATRESSAGRAAAAVFIEDEVSAATPIVTVAKDSVERIVELRRSAQAYDAAYRLPYDYFVEMLNAFFETQWQPQLQAMPRVHLVFAVHQVENLTPGIYVLPRSDSGEQLLRAQLTRWPEWASTDISIGSRTLFRIKAANTQLAAGTLCCQQKIASDCSFVTGFLGEFDAALDRPSNYCDLFQEAGALAQSAYLRATALGIAGTGIGCFFDDEWHELLGIKNAALQFVYHFATGRPLLDTRLTQHPGYFHLGDHSKRSVRRYA